MLCSVDTQSIYAQSEVVLYECSIERCETFEGMSRTWNTLSHDCDMKMIAYCNTSYATCPMTRRSIIGFGIKLGKSLISWKTKKQSTISVSLAKSEYQAMAKTVSEIGWIRGLLSDFGVQVDGPTMLFCDNDAAVKIATNPVFHERTKHIKVDCHFSRDKIQEGIVTARGIGTVEQLADVFTKLPCQRQHIPTKQAKHLRHI